MFARKKRWCSNLWIMCRWNDTVPQIASVSFSMRRFGKLNTTNCQREYSARPICHEMWPMLPVGLGSKTWLIDPRGRWRLPWIRCRTSSPSHLALWNYAASTTSDHLAINLNTYNVDTDCINMEVLQIHAPWQIEKPNCLILIVNHVTRRKHHVQAHDYNVKRKWKYFVCSLTPLSTIFQTCKFPVPPMPMQQHGFTENIIRR